MFHLHNFFSVLDNNISILTLVLPRGVATTPPPNSFRPGAQKCEKTEISIL